MKISKKYYHTSKKKPTVNKTESQQSDKGVHEPQSNNGYTVIPNRILKDIKLSTSARLLYCVLLSYAWKEKDYCHPPQKNLAGNLGLKTRRIRGLLTELEKCEYIEIKQRGCNKTNYYILKILPDRKKTFRSGTVVPIRTGNFLPLQSGNIIPTNQYNKNNIKINKSSRRIEKVKKLYQSCTGNKWRSDDNIALTEIDNLNFKTIRNGILLGLSRIIEFSINEDKTITWLKHPHSFRYFLPIIRESAACSDPSLTQDYFDYLKERVKEVFEISI